MVFTARNRQNAFAKRRRAQAEAAAAAEAAATPEPVAVPFDRNPESEEYEQAPDIATFATGGFVELPAEVDEDSSTPPLSDAEDVEREAPAAIEISAETQAKIDAIVSHTVPPIAEPVEEIPKYAAGVTTGALGNTVGLGGDRVPVVAPEQIDESKRGRGRPRPQETIDRDNAVHELLKAADADGVSKEALAISLGEKEQQVYSSLRQLSKEERAETRYVKGRGYRWFAV